MSDVFVCVGVALVFGLSLIVVIVACAVGLALGVRMYEAIMGNNYLPSPRRR